MNELITIKQSGTIVQQLDNKTNIIGTFKNGILTTSKKEEKHRYRKLNSWGLSKKVVDNSRILKIQFNILGTKYLIPKEDFISKSIIVKYSGFEEQYMFPNNLLANY